jgi:hypothetical protein
MPRARLDTDRLLVGRELLDHNIRRGIRLLRDAYHRSLTGSELIKAHGRRCQFAAVMMNDCLRLAGLDPEFAGDGE